MSPEPSSLASSPTKVDNDNDQYCTEPESEIDSHESATLQNSYNVDGSAPTTQQSSTKCKPTVYSWTWEDDGITHR